MTDPYQPEIKSVFLSLGENRRHIHSHSCRIHIGDQIVKKTVDF